MEKNNKMLSKNEDVEESLYYDQINYVLVQAIKNEKEIEEKII